jgi:hypothetical protein
MQYCSLSVDIENKYINMHENVAKQRTTNLQVKQTVDHYELPHLVYSRGDGLLMYLKWGTISAIFSVLALTWFIRYMIIEICSS